MRWADIALCLLHDHIWPGHLRQTLSSLPGQTRIPTFCWWPCPSLPPPFAQQSAFLWPFFLQLWHTTLELAFRAFSTPFAQVALPFPFLFAWAANAWSEFCVLSLLMMQCWASSIRNVIRSFYIAWMSQDLSRHLLVQMLWLSGGWACRIPGAMTLLSCLGTFWIFWNPFSSGSHVIGA